MQNFIAIHYDYYDFIMIIYSVNKQISFVVFIYL